MEPHDGSGESYIGKCFASLYETIARTSSDYLVPGYRNLSYEERLHNTSVIPLEDKRFYAKLVFTFQCIHKLSGCSLNDIGLSLR